MKLQEVAAKHFGIKPEEVTDEHLAACKEIAAAYNADAGVDEQKASIEKLRQEVADLKARPLADPDQDRINLDRLSRCKSFPEVERLVRQAPQDENEKAAQEVWDGLYFLSTALGNRKTGEQRSVPQLRYWEEVKGIAPSFAKALDTATSGEGSQWAPTEYSSTLIDMVFDNTVVADAFPRITIPRSPYVPPFAMTGGTAYLAGENTGDTPTNYTTTTPATANVTMTAKKLAVHIIASDELEEESIIPLLPQLRATVARNIAEGIEDAILDGDTTASHMDSDVTSAADRRKAWDGLRNEYLNTLSTASKDCGTFSADVLSTIMNAMTQKYLNNPQDVVWIFPTIYRYKIYTLLDNATNKIPLFLRASELGDNIVLRGQAGELFGNPLIFSSRMRTNLNASGVYDGVTTDNTYCLYVYRPGWVIADRRQLQIEWDREIRNGTSSLVATWRGAFTKVMPTADVITGGGYNLAV